MSKHPYLPTFWFILTDKQTGRFPKTDTSLISKRLLTDTLAETYTFDDRDSQDLKVNYYNALYKGVAKFEAYIIPNVDYK